MIRKIWTRRTFLLLFSAIFAFTSVAFLGCGDPDEPDDPTPPGPVDPDPPVINPDAVPGNKKLVFIHHSTGGYLLADGNGELAKKLTASGFYVSDICYEWDAPQNHDIGSTTDIGSWYTWFADVTQQSNGVARRDNIMNAVYAEFDKDSYNSSNFGSYTRAATAPEGANEVVLIKSCYPNSNLENSGDQSIFGKEHNDATYTVANCQAVYNAILPYFKDHPDKMFVVITAPSRPGNSGVITSQEATNARSLNNWLVNEWLQNADYVNKNVYVWDYFNVLTNANNHHYVVDGAVRHVTASGSGNYTISAYDLDGQGHPNTAGSSKGATELTQCIDLWYSIWRTWVTEE